MLKNPYTYEVGATDERIRELVDCLSPIEIAPEGLTAEMMIEYRDKKCAASYAVLIDGRLAGICFVEEYRNHREMCFAKTEYLTTSRKITFAKSIASLFADLNRYECRRMGGKDAFKPMYMHTPEGDERSKAWFVASGCQETRHGLKCPSGRGGGR